jgi:hypothetical protein
MVKLNEQVQEIWSAGIFQTSFHFISLIVFMFTTSADTNLLVRYNKVHYTAENSKLSFDEAQENILCWAD